VFELPRPGPHPGLRPQYRRKKNNVTIKTAKDLTSSLHGAAFRRAIWDGRSRLLRSIKTLRTLRFPERSSRAIRGPAALSLPVIHEELQAQSEPSNARVRRF
jgi:hypothetical protein